MTDHRDIKYIDLHTHILPGIDDGAESTDEALRMAGIAYEEGIRLIIATPHYGIMNPGFSRFKAEEVFEHTRSAIKAKYPDMGFGMGNEIFYTGPAMIDHLAKGAALTIAGTDYVLVEFSPADPLKKMEAGIRDLRLSGFRPILAHAERYEDLYKDLGAVEDIIDAGAIIQINSRSLTRGRLDKRTRWVRQLIKEDMVHLISSDCHNDTTRAPIMAEAAKKLREWTDDETLIKIMAENPRRILQNKFL